MPISILSAPPPAIRAWPPPTAQVAAPQLLRDTVSLQGGAPPPAPSTRPVAASGAAPSVAVPIRAADLNLESFRMDHDLDVRLDPARSRMAAVDNVTVTRIPSDGRVRFLLDSGLHVRGVTRAGEPVPFARDGNRVELRLDGHAGEAARLKVRYDGAIPGPDSGPNGVYLYDETFWHPSQLGDQGPSSLTVSMPADWHGTASADEEDDSVADGRRTCTWETSWAGSGLSLAAARYEVSSSERDGRRFRTFLFQDAHADAAPLVDRCARAIRCFEPLFGPYPYDHLDLAESTSEMAGGSPSVISFNTRQLQDKTGLDDFVSHEISHNWWAGALAGYTEKGIWYEAFAEFSANLFTWGRPDSSTAVATRRDRVAQWSRVIGPAGATPVRDVKTYEPWDRVEQVAYYKGAAVLHMLRDRLGDDAFFRGLRKFVADNTGSFPDWGDAEAAFEGASGQDLSRYFSQWLDRGDAPSLALQDVKVAAREGGWTVAGRIQQVQQGDPYALDVPVRIHTADGQVVEKQVPLGDRAAAFSWSLPGQPVKVEVDPDARIFRLQSDGETWSAARMGVPVTLAMTPQTGTLDAPVRAPGPALRDRKCRPPGRPSEAVPSTGREPGRK